MLVVATAGHVDHGKSALVRALTGTDPDRLPEERRRGLTLDLGHAHCRLPSGRRLALVDVPGHERYLGTALTGLAGAPAALLVVAADAGWQAQTEEHWQALRALGSHGLLVAVTRCDLADPAAVAADAAARTAAPVVTTSARTGAGLDALLAALDVLAPAAPAPADRVRLWVDRAFTAPGRGTVVTGTLGAGRLRVGDAVALDGAATTVRGLQVLGEDVPDVEAPARVAVLLRDAARPRRGAALLTAGAWDDVAVADVAVVGAAAPDVATHVVAHLGAAQVGARVRPLGTGFARLQLDRPLPLAVGDRLLLRDPSRHRPMASADVVEPAPRELLRRGAAARRADELASWQSGGVAAGLVARDGAVPLTLLRRLGLRWDGPTAQGRALDPAWLEATAAALRQRVPPEGLRSAGLPALLALPDRALLPVVVDAAGLHVREGWVVPPEGPGLGDAEARVADVVARAGTAVALEDHGLSSQEVALAARTGALVALPDGLVALPASVDRAVAVLAALPAPFAVRQARDALGVQRRVAVALLEHLDRCGRTRRRGDLRSVVGAGVAAGGPGAGGPGRGGSAASGEAAAEPGERGSGSGGGGGGAAAAARDGGQPVPAGGGAQGAAALLGDVEVPGGHGDLLLG